MAPEEIVAKIADALEQFKPIDGQPPDTGITRIREVFAPLLLQIPYGETEGTHSLIGFIWTVVAYTTRYGVEFSKPLHIRAYDATINENAMSVVRARTEAAHKAKRADRGTYETAQSETAQFILSVVEDTWVQELRDT